MKKSIVLCADDYGQAKAISEGIISLLEKNRLSAVSCLVTESDWLAQAEWLRRFQDQVDIGLHFNLTHNGPYSLKQLMGLSMLRCVNANLIEQALNRQLDRFIQGMGKAPDFIDGHQHVHQFPVIREVLMKVYQARLKEANPYIRLINGQVTHLKKAIIYGMGTKRLSTLLLQRQIPHNSSFSGIYDFRRAGGYPTLFPQFLAESQNKGLIMCHPGSLGASHDPIEQARNSEFQYFQSPAFQAALEEAGVVIGRFA